MSFIPSGDIIMGVVDHIVKYTQEYELSDLHIHSDAPLAIRVDGEIRSFEEAVISRSEVEAFIDEHLLTDLSETFKKYRDADLSIVLDGIRFRANFYNAASGPAFVLRKIESEVPTTEGINLPTVVMEKLSVHNGLILVTGPTGSGKSTTLAAMIDKINSERNGNIITIEDPIEFVFERKKCIVSQREIGRDAYSFSHALRAALREDPDVILVGELRDTETITLALTAAETGHLVFGTLHTSGAPNTITRIIDACPPQQQAQVRSQLAQSLQMVITQRLFKKKAGAGRVAAFEVMVCNTAVRNLIRENKIFQITGVMQTARSEGMITMEYAIEQLINRQLINYEA